MDDLLSIGKVAEIMDVSVQTLRYYSNIDLITPAYINPESGYRYYSADQLHFIDRIKYLQKLGISLADIKTILKENNIFLLLDTLEKRRKACLEKIQSLQKEISDIDWYKDYFTYIDSDHFTSDCYSLHFETRYLLAVKCMEGESRQNFHVRLYNLKSSLQSIPVKRQFSYILDYDSFIDGELNPKYLGMFLDEAPSDKSIKEYDELLKGARIIEIPAGNYFCFKSRILSDSWDTSFPKLFFMGKSKPAFVMANEYENSLQEYSKCVYEVQIHIPV